MVSARGCTWHGIGEMKRGWLSPIVDIAESLLDSSVTEEQYRKFLQSSIDRLDRIDVESAGPPIWASELSLAIDNLETTPFSLEVPERLKTASSFSVPQRDDALNWFGDRSSRGVLSKGTVERFTAADLLSLLGQRDTAFSQEIEEALEALLRHVELRRKKSLQLRSAETPSESWYERHDTAILFARAARRWRDLRFLNAAMKLTDWALPVHRRSVPPDLLARYVLAISEVRRAYEDLL